MSDKKKPGRSVNNPNTPNQNRQGQPQQPVDRTVFRNNEKTRVQSRQPAVRSGKQSLPDATRTPARKPVDSTNIAPRRTKPENTTRIKPSAVPPDQTHSSEQRTRMRNKVSDSHGTSSTTSKRTSVGQHQTLKGRFTLDKVIGVGGMGVVYKATDRLKIEAKDREPFVAIKVLSEEFKSHPESFIALQRESRKTQRIAHPNVVKVFDFDRDGDVVFMTMEYMEGRTLDQLIKQYSTTGLALDDVWQIMDGLCSAMTYAHNERIVHSDFKPGNIFITNDGSPKIFDFGIARAVANIDRISGAVRDRTVFDAGSLGALTPAYASMEMLLGEEPDIRDDIYALGCIAYEMLTGEHPYNRIPADEACKNRLRPSKIPGIKKRQWKAIEKSLAFKRADRVSSVEEFYSLIQPKAKSSSIFLATVLIMLSIGIATFFIVQFSSSPQERNVLQLDEIEFKIRYDLFKEEIDRLIGEATFSFGWERSIWEKVTGMASLLDGQSDDWLTAARKKIYQMYLDKMNAKLRNKNLEGALALLENAYRYTSNSRFLDKEKKRLLEMIRQEKLRKKSLAEKTSRNEKITQTSNVKAAKRVRLFELALKNVNQQLRCESKLNMRDFGIAINKLRSLNSSRYVKLENDIVVTLAGCLNQIGKVHPARALEAKRYALRIFHNNSLISSVTIVARDTCDKSIAGLGARGERAVCRDKLAKGGVGPAMVVIPGARNSLRPFAIGKYEVTVKEINQYCRASRDCKAIKGVDQNLPVSNVSIKTAKGYIRWLSRSSKKKYRLPTRSEWIHAANATARIHDPNRNCVLNSRGIEKGGRLARATAGRQNTWGLVNYLGNIQEWVYDKNRNLVTVGGSFEDPMERCNVAAYSPHSGAADNRTGFRVVREIKNK